MTLLSLKEYMDYFGIDPEDSKTDSRRFGRTRDEELGYCGWWLREVKDEIAEGAAFKVGPEANWITAYVNGYNGIRPVIWISK